MPIKVSGKEFALDKAYERFAFLKSLQKHKEQQETYEHILRRTGEDTEEDISDEIVINMDEPSSTSSEDED